MRSWIILIMITFTDNVFLETPYELQLGDGAKLISRILLFFIIGYYIVTTYLASKLRGVR